MLITPGKTSKKRYNIDLTFVNWTKVGLLAVTLLFFSQILECDHYSNSYMDTNLIFAVVIFLCLVIAYLVGRLQGRKRADIPQDFIDLYKQVEGLPVRVLQTIQGSINPQKGKMAELLTYAELRYDYDRIIPLGWPIDFVGIKNGERIDFIEVKSGVSHALTDEEKHIKNLIADGKVHFRLIKVSEDEVERVIKGLR